MNNKKDHNSNLTATVTAVNKLEKKVTLRNERILNTKEKDQTANGAVLSLPRIEQVLIEKNKVKVINKTQRLNKEKKKYEFVRSGPRYSIVNSFAREDKRDNKLYVKFSKMSVEYSQT